MASASSYLHNVVIARIWRRPACMKANGDLSTPTFSIAAWLGVSRLSRERDYAYDDEMAPSVAGSARRRDAPLLDIARNHEHAFWRRRNGGASSHRHVPPRR